MVSVSNDQDVCPYCRDEGKSNRLVIVQSTWKSAMVLCSDPQCIYPLDKILHTVKRDWSQLSKDKSDADKTMLSNALSEMKLVIEKNDMEAKAEGELPNAESSNSADKGTESLTDENEALELDLFSKATASDVDDDFGNLLDYLAKLPNNPFSSFCELPLGRSHEIMHQQNEIARVTDLPAIILPDNGSFTRLPTYMDQKDGISSLECMTPQQMSSGNVLGTSLDRSEPRRYPQWPVDKRNDLSWLTAGIALVVHCRLIRCVLKSITQTLVNRSISSFSTESCIASVCAAYEMAMRKFLVGISLCDKETKIVAGSQSSDSGSGCDTMTGNSSVLSFGDPIVVRIPRSIHQRIVEHLNFCQELVQRSMIEKKSSSNHPADALAFLLDSHDSVRNLSVASYKSSISCTACQQPSVTYQASRAVTFELLPSISTFSMTGPNCCMSTSCVICGAAGQVATIEWQSFSPLLFLHFPVGLPEDCCFEKFRLEMDALNVSRERIAGCERYCIAKRGKYELRVTAVVGVEYEDHDPLKTQYVTWVRRGNDSWMACRETFGEGSYMTEWDPLVASREAGVIRCNVRILLFEAVPGLKSDGLRKSRSANFLDAQRPPSLLQQRYLSILSQRRREHQASAATTSGVTGDGPTPTLGNSKNMIQRFLHSEIDHKACLGSSGSRFEPYVPEVRTSAAAEPEETKKKEKDSKNEACQSKSVNEATQSRQLRPRPSNVSASQRVKRPSSQSDISAISLWPPSKRKCDQEPAGLGELTPPSPAPQVALPAPQTSTAFTDELFEGLVAKDSEAL